MKIWMVRPLSLTLYVVNSREYCNCLLCIDAVWLLFCKIHDKALTNGIDVTIDRARPNNQFVRWQQSEKYNISVQFSSSAWVDLQSELTSFNQSLGLRCWQLTLSAELTIRDNLKIKTRKVRKPLVANRCVFLVVLKPLLAFIDNWTHLNESERT